MKHSSTTPEPSPRPESRDDARDQAEERFRSTARHIATQLDIEAAMWQILGKPPQ